MIKLGVNSYYIPHKLKIGDITHLSDSDSEIIISSKLHEVEDIINVETLQAVFRAVITDISTSSVEVEILEETKEIPKAKPASSITLLQALSGDRKFNNLIEKCVQLGVTTIIPLETEYSTMSEKEATKKMNSYRKIIKDAVEQSRNPSPTEILEPVRIEQLYDLTFPNTTRLCFATENVKTTDLQTALQTDNQNYVIAVGPETGWSSKDLKVLENLRFKFVKLKGNILRTETAGIVVSSIIQYLNGNL
jgi:16S rRNA (uracil1498-N3)-methyltransferase